MIFPVPLRRPDNAGSRPEVDRKSTGSDPTSEEILDSKKIKARGTCRIEAKPPGIDWRWPLMSAAKYVRRREMVVVGQLTVWPALLELDFLQCHIAYGLHPSNEPQAMSSDNRLLINAPNSVSPESNCPSGAMVVLASSSTFVVRSALGGAGGARGSHNGEVAGRGGLEGVLRRHADTRHY